MGHCRYCGHGAAWLRSSHRQCAATYRQGLAQMVDLVVAASGRPNFTQRRMLRILDGLAQQRYVPAEYPHAVLAAGWLLSDMNRMVDDVLTRSETARLREFRDGHHPASETPGDPGASILAAATRAALAMRQRSPRMERVSNLLQRSGLSHEDRRELLLQAWGRGSASTGRCGYRLSPRSVHYDQPFRSRGDLLRQVQGQDRISRHRGRHHEERPRRRSCHLRGQRHEEVPYRRPALTDSLIPASWRWNWASPHISCCPHWTAWPQTSRAAAGVWTTPLTGRSPCTPTRPPKRTAEVGRRPYIFARTDPEGLLGSRPPPDVPQDWTALSVDGSHIDVDRHLPLRCHLINLGGCAITYGAGLRLTAVQRAHPGRGGRGFVPPFCRRRARRDPDRLPACGLRPPTSVRWSWPPTSHGPAPPSGFSPASMKLGSGLG